MVKFQERRAVRHAIVTRLYIHACTLSCFKNAGVSCSWVKIQLNFLNFELTQGQPNLLLSNRAQMTKVVVRAGARTLSAWGGGGTHILGVCPTNFF